MSRCSPQSGVSLDRTSAGLVLGCNAKGGRGLLLRHRGSVCICTVVCRVDGEEVR